jgi:hypothetical protein
VPSEAPSGPEALPRSPPAPGEQLDRVHHRWHPPFPQVGEDLLAKHLTTPGDLAEAKRPQGCYQLCSIPGFTQETQSAGAVTLPQSQRSWTWLCSALPSHAGGRTEGLTIQALPAQNSWVWTSLPSSGLVSPCRLQLRVCISVQVGKAPASLQFPGGIGSIQPFLREGLCSLGPGHGRASFSGGLWIV